MFRSFRLFFPATIAGLVNPARPENRTGRQCPNTGAQRMERAGLAAKRGVFQAGSQLRLAILGGGKDREGTVSGYQKQPKDMVTGSFHVALAWIRAKRAQKAGYAVFPAKVIAAGNEILARAEREQEWPLILAEEELETADSAFRRMVYFYVTLQEEDEARPVKTDIRVG
jgi:hypothetical protein